MLLLLELFLWSVLCWFFITQLILPIVRGTIVLPMFNKRAVIEARIVKAKEAVAIKELEELEKKINDQAKK